MRAIHPAHLVLPLTLFAHSGAAAFLMRLILTRLIHRLGEALGLKVTFNNLTKVASPLLLGSMACALGLLPVFLLTAALLGAGGWFSQAIPSARKTQAP